MRHFVPKEVGVVLVCVCVYGDSSAFGLEILIWLKIKALLALYFSAFLGLVEDNE